MQKKRKILLITPYIPYPINSGGSQAFFNMTNQMRKEFDISLLLTVSNDKDLKNIESLKRIWEDITFHLYHETQMVVNKKWYHSFLTWMYKFSVRKLSKLNRSEDLVRNKSTLSHSYFQPFSTNFHNFIYHTSRRGFDIIQVEFFEYLSLVYLFPPEVKKVFVHHELRYIHNEGEISLFKQITPTDKMLFHITKEYELSTLSNYDYIITLTEIDAKLLASSLKKSHIFVSPAAVLKDCTGVLTKFKPAIQRITFVGSKEHFPNQDGIIWFCNEVIPCLRKMNFLFSIELIGQWKNRHIELYTGKIPELKILGYVEDLAEAIRGSISIIPIRIGSGMRIKILDAIMAPAPFVSTTKGAEGIDLRNSIDCYITDNPQEFAESIINLCKNEKLQKELVTNALQRLQIIYNPQEMIEKRCAFYDKLIKNE